MAVRPRSLPGLLRVDLRLELFLELLRALQTAESGFGRHSLLQDGEVLPGGIQYGVRPLPIDISQKRSDPILKAMS